MYFIYLINFGYYKDTVFDTIEDAYEAAMATGFECSICKVVNGVTEIIAAWSPISGLKITNFTEAY